ncbi:MAG: IPT/TIG domain-containing protein [Solirubrobacterales bacterium]
MQRRFAAVAIGSLLAMSMSALGASSASALIVQLENGKTISYQPLRPAVGLSALSVAPLASGNLIYHGGPVMTSNTNYTFYWSPSGASAYPAGYQTGVNRYLEDLAHDSGGNQNVDSVATQYSNGGGEAAAYDSHFGGAILDTDPYPKNGCKKAPICLTDAQLQAELSSWIAVHGLPKDLAHEYFLLTPPGVEDCFEAAGTECSAASNNPTYCAYHGSFASGGGKIVYSNDAYVTEVEGCDDGEHPNESPSDGALEGGLSHEHNESITDPELNAWYDAEGSENGDKCRTFVASSEFGTPLGKAPDGSRYNQLIDGREYWYQQEWSNEGSVCKQRFALATPAVTKVSPVKGPASGGTVVKITGTGFAGITAVHFGAQSASFTVASSSKITATAPPGTTGTVDVTVTNAAGTSALSAADRFKYAPSVTAVKPGSGSTAGGTNVTVTGAGFALGSGTIFKFGSPKATLVNCTSSTTCTMLTPAHAAATINVKATISGLVSPKSSGDQYTYV